MSCFFFICGKRRDNNVEFSRSAAGGSSKAEKHTFVINVHSASGIPHHVPNGQQVYVQFKRKRKKFSTDNALVDGTSVTWDDKVSFVSSLSRKMLCDAPKTLFSRIPRSRKISAAGLRMDSTEESESDSNYLNISKKLNESLSRRNSEACYQEKLYHVSLKADTVCGLGNKSMFFKGKTIAEGDIDLGKFAREFGDNEMEIVSLKLFPPLLRKDTKLLQLQPIILNLTVRCFKGPRLLMFGSRLEEEFREKSFKDLLLSSKGLLPEQDESNAVESSSLLLKDYERFGQKNVDQILAKTLKYYQTTGSLHLDDDHQDSYHSDEGSENGKNAYWARSPRSQSGVFLGVQVPSFRIERCLDDVSMTSQGSGAYQVQQRDTSDTFAPWVLPAADQS